MKAVSGKRLAKLAESKGWIFPRSTSSHHIYSRGGDRLNLSIPIHGNRDLKPGTQAELMKKAGLTEADL